MKFREWLNVYSETDPTKQRIYFVNQAFNDVADNHTNLGDTTATTKMSRNDIMTLIIDIKARFADYEMVEEDEDTLFNYFRDIFEEHYSYYANLLYNYRKDYDYATGNKRIVTRSDNINIQGQRDIEGNDDSKHTDYELPNKVVDEDYESTPSAISKDKSTSKTSNTYNNDTSHSSSVETEYKNEFIDLKNKYLAQIRDVFREFANKFGLCFQLVYGGF